MAPMSAKEIEVQCPCCDTLLIVDVLTQKVLRHADPRQVDETGKLVLDESRWDSASQKVGERHSEGLDRFDEALGKEKARSRDLDDLFEQAKKKATHDDQDDDAN